MKIQLSIREALPPQSIPTKSGRILYKQVYLVDGHGEYNATCSLFADRPIVPVAPGEYTALLSRLEGRDRQYTIVAEDLIPVPAAKVQK